MSHLFNLLAFQITFAADGLYLIRLEEGSVTMADLALEILRETGSSIPEPDAFNALVNALILFFEGSENYRQFLKRSTIAPAFRIFQLETSQLQLEELQDDASLEDLQKQKRMILELVRSQAGKLSLQQRELLLERSAELNARIRALETLTA